MLATLKTLFTAAALAVATPVLAGDTVLTISGDVATSQNGASWTFDMAALRALPTDGFETTTIWTEGPQRFDGVSLAVLMDHVGAGQGTIRALALNDYAVTIPMSDAVEGGPIVAYARNGADMRVRDKGPLWIVYPFDDNDVYKSEEYYSRSIWQLDRIEITATE